VRWRISAALHRAQDRRRTKLDAAGGQACGTGTLVSRITVLQRAAYDSATPPPLARTHQFSVRSAAFCACLHLGSARTVTWNSGGVLVVAAPRYSCCLHLADSLAVFDLAMLTRRADDYQLRTRLLYAGHGSMVYCAACFSISSRTFVTAEHAVCLRRCDTCTRRQRPYVTLSIAGLLPTPPPLLPAPRLYLRCACLYPGT